MKRRDLIRRLEEAGCEFVRHGGRHDIYRNPATGQSAPVPRHREVGESLARQIERQLGVVPPPDETPTEPSADDAE